MKIIDYYKANLHSFIPNRKKIQGKKQGRGGGGNKISGQIYTPKQT